MKRWPRLLLATVVCIIGGTVLAFVIAIPYVLFVQPDIERPTDLSLPQYVRALGSFGIVFAAVYLSSFVASRDARRQSSLVSGAFLVISFLVIALALPSSVPISRLIVPIGLDLVPIVAAIALSAFLHAPNVA